MLQSSSSGSFTPRPKPPRTRSNQLASSTSKKHLEHPGQTSIDAAKVKAGDHLQDVLRCVQQQAAVMIPETPPYTPELLSSELCQAQEGEVATFRTPEELEELLIQAQRTIQDRERDLGLAASIGKTLLENNTALRSRQTAFLQRVVSPVKNTSSGKQREGDVLEHLQIPLYGAKGEFIEALPPRSPRNSLILQRRHRQTSNPEEAWTDEEEEEHLRTYPARTYTKKNGVFEAKSPIRKRNSAGHTRQVSTSSTSSYASGQGRSPNKVSKSASDRQLAITLQLQEQHEALASQNAQLEGQLQELEIELQRADVSGKKKLRKLDRELDSLRQELQSALDRNRELEESLQRDKKSSSGSLDSHVGGPRSVRCQQRKIPDPIHAQEASLPPDTDSNEGLYSPPLPSIESDFQGMQTSPRSLISPGLAGEKVRGSSEAALVNQLLRKIAELKETNTAIELDKEQMDAKLQKASEEFEEMKRKYDFLEDRVIEAEVRAHRVIGWDRRATIGWYPGWEQPEERKAKLSPQRRAIGNRAMIERHRRLSSLFGGYPPPPQLYRSTAPSPIPSADGSPDFAKSARHRKSQTLQPLRDPFLRQESASPTKNGQAVNKDNDLEDLIDAMHRQVALDKRQMLATQQALTENDNASLESPVCSTTSPGLTDTTNTETALDQAAMLTIATVAVPAEEATALRHGRRDLLPPGPPDADSYEAMEKALADVPVDWADDDAPIAQRSLLKDIPDGTATRSAPTRHGGLEWAYEDPEEQSMEHDPWKDENSNKEQLGLESREMIEFRQRVDEKSERRRKRIQQLAEELLQDEEESMEALSAEHTLLALRRVGSDKSIHKREDESDRKSASSNSGEYEHVDTDRRLGSIGTDYWPISTRARYAPNMVAKRVAITSQEYVNMCLLWTRFIAVLGVAVAVSVWRGPKEGLGSAGISPRRRSERTPSRLASPPKRIGSMANAAPGL